MGLAAESRFNGCATLRQTVAFGSKRERRERKPAEGFLRCVAARPEERDAEEDGRHFGRNDRCLLR